MDGRMAAWSETPEAALCVSVCVCLLRSGVRGSRRFGALCVCSHTVGARRERGLACDPPPTPNLHAAAADRKGMDWTEVCWIREWILRLETYPPICNHRGVYLKILVIRYVSRYNTYRDILSDWFFPHIYPLLGPKSRDWCSKNVMQNIISPLS